jgi:transcriptional regulator of acetoin/glycerol metabolism
VCRGQTIHEGDLPAEVREGAGAAGAHAPRDAAAATATPPARAAAPAPAAGASGERERLMDALARHRWNRERAAAALGMSRTTLWRKMRELGLSS